MISIEKVLTMTCIKSPSLEIKSGRGVFSSEDALGVLAMAKRANPLGLRVLEAKVAGDNAALSHLNRTVTLLMLRRGYSDKLAMSLAYLAVKEVCGVPRCEKCKGTGEVHSRRYSKMFECKNCSGTGKILLNSGYLAKHLSVLSGQHVSNRVFDQVYYDDYMDAINELYVAETEAAHFISKTMDVIRSQLEVC